MCDALRELMEPEVSAMIAEKNALVEKLSDTEESLIRIQNEHNNLLIQLQEQAARIQELNTCIRFRHYQQAFLSYA